jgi:hypothetical protein
MTPLDTEIVKEPELIAAERERERGLTVVDKGTPLPVFTGAEMAQALTAYRELQRALDQAMPDQIIRLDDKPFRKKGYWRAIAVAFNLSVDLECEKREVYGVLENGGENYEWHVTYRATAPNGRTDTGDGACAASEKERGRMKATAHNVRSHAHTRAYNRAVSNLVGFGEVSAEEVERPSGGDKAANDSGFITDKQRIRLFAIAKEVGWTKDEVQNYLKTTHSIESSAQIPKALYDKCVSDIQQGAL